MVQRTYVNTESKYLLLRYAFEVLSSVHVPFTTDELNERSREAVRFSIIDTEWPDVRRRLEAMLASNPTFLVSAV